MSSLIMAGVFLLFILTVIIPVIREVNGKTPYGFLRIRKGRK